MLRKTLLASAIALATASANASVIISEYVEGGSYNKAVEIYNTGDTAVDLSTYALNFYFNGKTEIGRTITLSGELAPNTTYVVAHSRSAEELKAKAQFDTDGSWFNGDDAVTLTNSDIVVDSLGQIGVDPGSAWVSGDVRTQDRSLVRLESVKSGRTDAFAEFDGELEWMALPKDDFSNVGSHNQQTEEPDPVECGGDATLISAIQGTGDASPLNGETVEVQAVVTSSLQGDSQLKGFFIQEESFDQDNDVLTSEGIFVYYNKQTVTEGDVVKLRANVEEKYGQTQLNYVNDLKVCGTESFAPVEVSLPAENGLEAYEGMLVSVTNELVVNDTYGLSRYGELKLGTERLFQSTQVALPGDAANAVEAENKLKSITLDDGSSAQNPEVIPYPTPELDAYNTLRLGDKVTGLTGVMGYGYSQFRIHPTTTPNFIQENLRTEAPESVENSYVRIASFNVLNYFNGDGQGAGFPTPRGADTAEEFERQKAKTVNAILALDADVIGLLEMENDGFSELSAIADLVASLNAAQANDTYAFVNLATEQVGGDAIMSAIIYRSNKVEEVGTAAFTEAEPFDYGNRPPVMQTFTDKLTKETFSVVITHLRSKGSCRRAEGLDADQKDGQGCWNQTRVNAVNKLNEWLATNPTTVADEDMVILGDMNAYGEEDPIYAFVNNGFVNIKKQRFGHTRDYSYVYQGRIGSLDHAFASSSMYDKVVGIQDWHINADEPVSLDYNMEYKSEKHLTSLYADTPYRASDHDPIVIDFDTRPEPTIIEGKFENLSGWFWWNRQMIELPEGFDTLEVSIEGYGEADLYLRHDKKPTKRNYDCRPYIWGSNESCMIEKPEAGDWHIGLKGTFFYYDVTLSYKATKQNF